MGAGPGEPVGPSSRTERASQTFRSVLTCSSFYYVNDGDETGPVRPNWKHRADYIRTRSTRKESTGETNIQPEWADEAFTDPAAVMFSPDPAAKTGRSDRTIGWSETAGFVITVITVREGDTIWGANAWKSNDVDQRHYQRAEQATGKDQNHGEREDGWT